MLPEPLMQRRYTCYRCEEARCLWCGWDFYSVEDIEEVDGIIYCPCCGSHEVGV